MSNTPEVCPTCGVKSVTREEIQDCLQQTDGLYGEIGQAAYGLCDLLGIATEQNRDED